MGLSGPHTARAAALDALGRILDRGQALDEALDAVAKPLEARERAFCRAIVLASLRHKGSIEFLMARYLSRPLPKSGRTAHLALLSGAAQLLFVGSPPHAVVNEQVGLLPGNSKFRGVVNAILRRFDNAGRTAMADPKVRQRDLPGWLWQRWKAAYGAERTMAIGTSLSEDGVPLDLTVRADADGWAERLGGVALPTGSVRLRDSGNVADLDGYDDGAWWVQDAAAALPARLLGDVRGLRVLDACAAPGGKTAQLASAGALVTALDRSAGRLTRLSENLARLGLAAETAIADLREFAPTEPFDAILLDAPCTATGTLRRHPDIGWNRSESDVAALAKLQGELLDAAAGMIRPGGTLVYCTCSMEPEEGEDQARAFLERQTGFRRKKVRPSDLGLGKESVSRDGDLRTLPSHLAASGGMDGFFAARFVRN
ncbi:MAG: RsmB/NOP family class I SAM-dependent RNA methyltransferase [Minwuia sp.]|uniref:RsmB/NOP family class I SAM-dependent RNA methyltransferase n=1 Tax=Minwuia sp. TaxID=2493630 RepID=UPI003A897A2E